MPWPPRVTTWVCDTFEIVSLMVSVPVAGPTVCGTKETEMVQERWPPRLAPQPFAVENGPPVCVLMRVRVASPELVTITASDADRLPS